MLVLEQDDTLVVSDRMLLYHATREAGCAELRYEHHRAATELLLSLPDAIAWCSCGCAVAGPVAAAHDASYRSLMTEKFTDHDGIDIVYRHWPAVGEQRGSVVIAHGASEHSGRYARFAARLTDDGWDVVAPDHRGHGETGRLHGAGLLGPRGFDGVLDDVHHLVQQAAAPVVLIGHSMGSAIALRYAERHGRALAALVLTGVIGVMAGVDESIAALQGALDGGLTDEPMNSLGPFNEPFEPARTPFDWLSRDDAEVDAYIADPLSGDGNPLSYGYMHALLSLVRDGAADVADLPEALPVLLAAGERDPVSNGTVAVRALAESMRQADLVVAESYYPDARHEILNETNRDEVETDIVRWLADTVS